MLTGMLLALALGAGAGEPVLVEVRLTLGEGQAASEVLLEARPSEGGEALAAVAVAVPGTTQLRLPPGSWQLGVTAPGYWAAPAAVTVAAGEPLPPLELALWPAGELRGRLRLPEGERRPEAVRLRFRAVPPLPGARAPRWAPPEAEVSCRVLVSAHFRCPLPAGSWNLRVSAPGYAPHYVWSQQVAAAGMANLADLELQRGGSVAGWLPTCEGVAQRSGCRVALSPVAGGQVLDARTQAGLTDRGLSVAVAENGFFQLTGVPAGSYTLSATQQGFAPARFFPLLVVENRETELREPLLLEPPLTLQVNIDPAMDPWGQPWDLTLWAEGELPSHRSEVASAEEPGPAGIWHWRGLAPGTYVVDIGDGRGQHWEHQRVELRPGNEVLDVHLPLVRVRGVVRLGKEGLAAKLHWPVSIYMESDEEGEFSGILPRSGRYRMVMLRAADPPIKRSFSNVEVTIPEGQDEAWVEFRVPATEVRGVVVDETGKPVAAATVFPVSLGDVPGSTRVDKDGRFRLAGLPEGMAVLQAESATGMSEAVTVALSEETTPPDVRLTIRARRELRGVVIGPGGGVPGARVLAWTPDMLSGEFLVTAGDGSFSTPVSAQAGQAQAIVQAPGYLFAVYNLPLTGEAPVQLPVHREGGGTLMLTVPQVQEPAGPPVAMFALHKGVLVSISELIHWRGVNGLPIANSGSPVAIPQVEPGDWALCRQPITGIDHGGGLPQVQSQHCVSGYLAPGGELELAVGGTS